MFEDFKKTYSGKKVFVTGHTGFKGAWLIKMLSLLGASIKGYALASEHQDDLYNLIDGDKLVTSVIGDLRDRELLQKELISFAPDFIFHLAAQPLVRLSYDIPYETFEVNALGSASLLDAVRTLKNACNIILITTDKVYHNNEWEYPYREGDRLGGYDPYSASKACTELVIDSYKNSFFNPAQYAQHGKAIAVARAGNVIGGGDWAKDRLIPDIVLSLYKDTEIIIRNPNAVRPWQHVLEPLSGYLLLGEKLSSAPMIYNQAYNFGPLSADTLSVEEMVKAAIATWGAGSYQVTQPANAPHEAGLLRLDISRAQQHLKWKPRYNSSEALDKTIAWYRSFKTDRASIAFYTEQQIMSFLHE